MSNVDVDCNIKFESKLNSTVYNSIPTNPQSNITELTLINEYKSTSHHYLQDQIKQIRLQEKQLTKDNSITSNIPIEQFIIKTPEKDNAAVFKPK